MAHALSDLRSTFRQDITLKSWMASSATGFTPFHRKCISTHFGLPGSSHHVLILPSKLCMPELIVLHPYMGLLISALR